MAIFKSEFYDTLKSSKNDVYEFIKDKEKPARSECAKSFLGHIGYAAKLTFQEKEIITFSIAQVIVIGIVYYFFIQVLNFIPDEVWKSAENSSDNATTIADLVILIWAIICVGIAAFPIGIFSGAIAAAHFLRRAGKQSTIATCVRMALSRSWSIWMLTWLDSWLTVMRIVDRLPKKNDKRSTSQKLMSEMIYYAWKLLTIGMIPALITGHTPLNACKESVLFLKSKSQDLITLRIGYSFFCWIIGILTYIGGIYFLFHSNILDETLSETSRMIRFYTYAGIPIILSTAIVQLLLRPIYLITACEIYSDYLQEKGETPQLIEGQLYQTASIFFILLCGLTLVGYQYADELGIKKMLATPYTEPAEQQSISQNAVIVSDPKQ